MKLDFHLRTLLVVVFVCVRVACFVSFHVFFIDPVGICLRYSIGLVSCAIGLLSLLIISLDNRFAVLLMSTNEVACSALEMLLCLLLFIRSSFL